MITVMILGRDEASVYYGAVDCFVFGSATREVMAPFDNNDLFIYH